MDKDCILGSKLGFSNKKMLYKTLLSKGQSNVNFFGTLYLTNENAGIFSIPAKNSSKKVAAIVLFLRLRLCCRLRDIS